MEIVGFCADKLPAISPHEVHIWELWLNEQRNSGAGLLDLLSLEERERAARYRFAIHRQRFIACRAQLRRLLAGYTADSPENISLLTDAHGKPRLSEAATCIRFNVSHSQDLAVLAFGLGRDIGIDVEAVRMGDWQDQMARAHFSAEEYRFYTKTPRPQRNRVFFDCWTRKEACLKAIGLGLSYPMHQICVDLSRHRSEQLIRADEPKSWTVETFTPAPGYQAAIVAEGSDWTPVYLSCSDLNRQSAHCTQYIAERVDHAIDSDTLMRRPPQSAIVLRQRAIRRRDV